MPILEDSVGWIPIVLGVLGAFLLFREAWIAQEVEKLSPEIARIKELQYLYETNTKEFVVRSLMYAWGSSRTDTQELLNPFGLPEASEVTDAEFRELHHAEWQHWSDHISPALKRWDDFTLPEALNMRRWLLWSGFGLIVVAAVIQLLGRIVAAAT